MILDYIKGFLTLFLLIKVLLYFVPKSVFEKYIAFVAGVILVIGLLHPLLQFFGQEKKISEKVQQEEWEIQLQEIVREAEKLEETGKTFVEESYQKILDENTEEEIVIEAVKIGGET